MVKYFRRIPTYVITIHQRHRQTDRQTTCDCNTRFALKCNPVKKTVDKIRSLTNVLQTVDNIAAINMVRQQDVDEVGHCRVVNGRSLSRMLMSKNVFLTFIGLSLLVFLVVSIRYD